MSLTPKQERFCQVYLETGNASEAYRQSYNCTKMKPESINRMAKELMDNLKIASRLAELKKPAIEAAQVTYEGHLNELAKLRDLAVSSNQLSAAIQAEISRGKAADIYVERVQSENVNYDISPEVMTEDEWEDKYGMEPSRGPTESTH